MPRTMLLAGAAMATLLLVLFLALPLAAAATTHHIHMQNIAYNPAEKTVARGDTVEWHNHDNVNHDASSSAFQSQTLGNGQSWSWAVPGDRALGAIAYLCNFHQIPGSEMRGALNVQNLLPSLSITRPAASEQVAGTFNVQGTASDADGGALKELKVTAGAQDFFGTPSAEWSVEVTTAAAHGATFEVKVRLKDSDDGVTERFVTLLRNDPPVAAFTVSPAVPTSADTLQFTSTSTDEHLPLGSQSWDFGDGTSSTAPNATHRFAKGARTVNLTAVDDHGLSATATRALTIANGAPRANFSITPADPAKNEAVAFTDRSDDIDGDATAWAWDFGDGGNSTQRNATHTFLAAGTYTVKLTVTDAEGASNVLQKGLVVEEFATQRPIAQLSVAPPRGQAPFAVTFTLDGSDPDGTVSNWTLDYGDGSSPLSGPGSLFAGAASHQQGHTYLRNGTFEAVLTVRDNLGATGTNRTSVIVDPPPNRPPVVRYEVAPTASPRKGQLLTFADASSDLDFEDRPISWDWNFGDGTRTCCRNSTVTHAYTRVGRFEVQLTVKDTLGSGTTVPVVIEVSGQPPAASFEANATQGRAPFPVTFNLKARDDDGRVESWGLDFGDGTAPERGDTGPTNVTVRHVYENAGSFAAQFDVFDDDGLSRRIVLSIAVASRVPEPLPLGPESISVSPQSARFTYRFAATTTMPGDITYLWSFGDGRTATGKEVEYSYDQAGAYTVTLTLQGPQGPVARGTRSIGVGEDPGSVQERLTANVASGTVRVKWDPVASAGGYQVWRFTGAAAATPGAFQLLENVTATSHFDDFDVRDGESYTYQVTFFSPDGTGRMTKLTQLSTTDAFRRIGQVKATGLVDGDGDGVGDTRDLFPQDSTRSVAPSNPWLLPLVGLLLLGAVGLAAWKYQEPLKARLAGGPGPGELTAIPGLQPQHAAVLQKAGIHDTRMLAVADPADVSRRTIITKPVLDHWVAVAQLLQLPGIPPVEAAQLAGAGIRGPWDLARADPAALAQRLKEVPLAKAQRWVRTARRATSAS